MAQPPEIICDALAKGTLSNTDLTARRLGEFLGKTTSVLYHHWGSLDGFLHAVAQAGMRRLGAALLKETSLVDVAERFVRFGLDHTDLYALMFERIYDWDALRDAGAFDKEMPGLSLWQAMVAHIESLGSADPEADARLLYAGLHGLVSLASTGRANVGALTITDRDVAIDSARRLVHRLLDTKEERP